MSVMLRNANFMHTAHAQFGLAHAAGDTGRHYCLTPRGVPDSVFERDTESEDRDQRRRRLATLCKWRQRSKNADNDRKRSITYKTYRDTASISETE